GLKPAEPDRLAPGSQVGLRELPELEEVRGVPLPQVLAATGSLESLVRELADRLQHPEAAVCEPDEALLDQRLQRVQVGAADGLGRFQGAAAGKDREAGEEPPLLLGEEVVAPGDRRPQGLLARFGI